jgi:hypothetical protein
MDRTDTSRLRKRLKSEPSSTHSERPGEIDIANHPHWPTRPRIRIILSST